MALVNPPAPTTPPTPPIQRGDRATFSNRVDATITYLTGAPAEIGNIATITYGNAVEAYNYAQTAMGYRDTAMTYRDAAQTARTGAETARTGAETARTGAETARDAAQGYAAALIGTSATSNVIGTGAKTFAGAGLAGKQFFAGQRVRAANPSNTAQRMDGTVTAYTNSGASSALAVMVDNVNAATAGNTVANWLIGPGGEPGAAGATGGVAGGNLTGALNLAKANDVPSAATIDPWSGAGNVLELTGSATITAVTAAPQAGATRKMIVTGTPSMTASADLIIKGVATGTTYSFAAGDEIEIVAQTPTRFRVTVTRADGAPISALYGSFMTRRAFTVSGVYVPRRSGWRRITEIGSAGRGGAIAVANGSGGRASGGGSPGFVVGLRYLVAGQAYIVTVAGPVAAATTNTNGTATPVADGADSSFTGAGITPMVAAGGKGGAAAAGAGTTAGGAGGTATGGDINVPGAAGGAATSVGTLRAAAGGASVGIFGQAYPGGSATANTAIAAGGGAGVGGAGGNGVNNVGAGGGAGGAASGATPGVNIEGNTGAPSALSYALLNAVYGGGVPSTSQAAGSDGAGSAGVALQTGLPAITGTSGVFSGVGGAASGDSSMVTSLAGGAYGGASGGSIGNGSARAAATGGGLVLIEE